MRWITSMALSVCVLFVQQAQAATLGERMESVISRHGPPLQTQNGGNRLIYRWQDWELTVDFGQGVAEQMKYIKATDIGSSDTDGILTANGGVQAWRLQSGPPWRWLRNDGARLSQLSPNSVVLESAVAVRLESTATAKPIVKSTPHQVVLATPTHRTHVQINQPRLNLSPWVALLVVAGLIWGAAGLSREHLRKAAQPSSLKPPKKANASSLQLSKRRGGRRAVQDLDWDEFEMLISELYRRRGFEVEFAAGSGPDAGIDVILRRDEERVLVQCKHWKAWKVGVKELREFFGVLVSDGAARGIFVTSKAFTREAVDFARGKPLELITGRELRSLLEESGLTHDGEVSDFDEWIPVLLKHATIPVPSCPNCSKTMVRKKSARGRFWGCSRFPHCYGKRELRRHLDGFCVHA